MIRTELHRIRPSSQYYKMLRRFCHLAKNLYNHGNYLVRQELFKNGTWIRYQMLDSLLKKDLDHPDYRAMPTARSAQQLLYLLDKNWKSVLLLLRIGRSILKSITVGRSFRIISAKMPCLCL